LTALRDALRDRHPEEAVIGDRHQPAQTWACRSVVIPVI
jgi:hypothetical protein